VDERQLRRVEAVVLSMTAQERRSPHLIDASRRRRIAAGSGTTIDEVNRLISARKQMEKMMKQLGKGKMPALPGLPAPNGVAGVGGVAQAPRPARSSSSRKRKKSRR
jgi:signal recognition particle subunit SRP54